jgi:hypothetical protein
MNPNRGRFATMEAERLQAVGLPGPRLRPTKKTLEQQFLAHQADCPLIPRGLDPEDPAFIAWYHEFSAWAAIKARLVAKLNTSGLHFDHHGREEGNRGFGVKRLSGGAA